MDPLLLQELSIDNGHLQVWKRHIAGVQNYWYERVVIAITHTNFYKEW